jgi:hypothetical protein
VKYVKHQVRLCQGGFSPVFALIARLFQALSKKRIKLRFNICFK